VLAVAAKRQKLAGLVACGYDLESDLDHHSLYQRSENPSRPVLVAVLS
jgi:hypothetical protein